MAKLFMYGTRLEGLEQMMMSVPNFAPRVKQKRMIDKLYHAESGGMSYEKAIKDCYTHISNQCFNLRLEWLIHNFDGSIFTDHAHKSRFAEVLNKENTYRDSMTPEKLSILFLLTTDETLWSLVGNNIDLHRCSFEKIKIKNLSVEAYALYQAARTINSVTERIKLDEIEDEEIVTDRAFKAIIHGTLLFKYGIGLLKVDWL